MRFWDAVGATCICFLQESGSPSSSTGSSYSATAFAVRVSVWICAVLLLNAGCAQVILSGCMLAVTLQALIWIRTNTTGSTVFNRKYLPRAHVCLRWQQVSSTRSSDVGLFRFVGHLLFGCQNQVLSLQHGGTMLNTKGAKHHLEVLLQLPERDNVALLLG